MPHMPKATLLSFVVVLLAAIAASAQPSLQSQLQSQVDQIAAQHHGQVAVYAKDLKTGQTVALKADEVARLEGEIERLISTCSTTNGSNLAVSFGVTSSVAAAPGIQRA